MKISISR